MNPLIFTMMPLLNGLLKIIIPHDSPLLQLQCQLFDNVEFRNMEFKIATKINRLARIKSVLE
jgi:hypothetical protein